MGSILYLRTTGSNPSLLRTLKVHLHFLLISCEEKYMIHPIATFYVSLQDNDVGGKELVF
jgi:hypothetical protein